MLKLSSFNTFLNSFPTQQLNNFVKLIPRKHAADIYLGQFTWKIILEDLES